MATWAMLIIATQIGCTWWLYRRLTSKEAWEKRVIRVADVLKPKWKFSESIWLQLMIYAAVISFVV